MSTNLGLLLLEIYPDLDISYTSLGETVTIKRVGSSQSISYWGDTRIEPTQQELVDADIGYKRKEIKKQINKQIDNRIAACFDKKSNSFDLVYAELNAAGTAIKLLKKIISGEVLTNTEIKIESSISNSFDLVERIVEYGGSLKTALLTADPDTFDINTGWPV